MKLVTSLIIGLVMAFSPLVLSSCKNDDRKGAVAKEQTVNAAISQLNSADQSAFSDVVNTLDKKLNSITQVAEKQNQVMQQAMKEVEENNQIAKANFERVADRLDQLDRSLSGLQGRYEEITKQIQGNNKPTNQIEGR